MVKVKMTVVMVMCTAEGALVSRAGALGTDGHASHWLLEQAGRWAGRRVEGRRLV